MELAHLQHQTEHTAWLQMSVCRQLISLQISVTRISTAMGLSTVEGFLQTLEYTGVPNPAVKI